MSGMRECESGEGVYEGWKSNVEGRGAGISRGEFRLIAYREGQQGGSR